MFRTSNRAKTSVQGALIPTNLSQKSLTNNWGRIRAVDIWRGFPNYCANEQVLISYTNSLTHFSTHSASEVTPEDYEIINVSIVYFLICYWGIILEIPMVQLNLFGSSLVSFLDCSYLPQPLQNNTRGCRSLLWALNQATQDWKAWTSWLHRAVFLGYTD